jgi:Ca-activated chloride channel family protein
MSDTISLDVTPLRDALLEGHNNACLALVRVKAPAAPALQTRRKALNLALVIDRSGSMSGRPLEEAKRCVGMIIDRLGPQDRAAVVVYDSVVDTIVPAQRVTDPAVFHRALAQVDSRGMTALFGGWLAGAEQAALGVNEDAISRVMLLSDGCANEGPDAIEDIGPHVATMAASGVSTSTCGLGNGFNEDLMMGMAKAGQGQGYYGDTAEDLLDPFTTEFELMRALCARKLRLSLQTPEGVKAKVLNEYTQEGDGRWAMPDLAFGAEGWALVSVTVPARLCTPGATIDQLLRVTVSLDDCQTDRALVLDHTVSLPTLPAGAFSALAEDARVKARAQELRAAELQLEARTAARRGRWDQVDQILRQAEQEAGDNPWVAEGLKALRVHAEARRTEEFAKESTYKARAMSSRLTSFNEDGSEYAAAVETAVPSFLRRKVEQGKRMPPAPDQS